MRGHVDAESLALCAEGLLSRRRSERIRSHVASCPGCAAAQARLTEVPALLAQVPPPPLPPGIAARLDAALSAETARRAAPDPGTVPGPAAPAPPAGTPPRHRAGRPRGPWLRMPVAARLVAAAGVLVVAGGVGYAVSQSSSSPSTSSSSAGPAAVPSAVAGPHSPSAASGAGPEIGAGAQFTVRHSGTPYRKTTLAAQARTLLAAPSAGLNSPGKGSGGLSRRAPGLALTGCVEKVAGLKAVRAGEVKLVDQARFQGRPATVIVVQATSAQPGTVYAAGAGCSASRADILATAHFAPSR
jgi:negative regulator of sigma E activity